MLVSTKNKDTAKNNSNSNPHINPLLNFMVIIGPAKSIENKVEMHWFLFSNFWFNEIRFDFSSLYLNILNCCIINGTFNGSKCFI